MLVFGIVTSALGIVALVCPGITIGVGGVLFGLQLLLVGLVCLTLAIGIYWVIHGVLLIVLGLTDAVPWGAG